MTPAIKQLERKQLPFELLQYEHDANAKSFGLEAVEKLALDAKLVFKTLVVCSDTEQLAVAVIPVESKLNLKAIAKLLKVKKIKMADAQRVESTTGYILGGISPLGQKKSLKTLIDSSAKQCEKIYISGGRRGLEIGLSPLDLANQCQASFAQIGL